MGIQEAVISQAKWGSGMSVNFKAKEHDEDNSRVC